MARGLVQLLPVLGRAFVNAWKKASEQAKKEGGKGGGGKKGGKGETPRKKGLFARKEMSIEEASQILGLADIRSTPLSKALLKQKYDHLFTVNDPKKGSSFYLQSKVYRANERLEQALANKEIEFIDDIDDNAATQSDDESRATQANDTNDDLNTQSSIEQDESIFSSSSSSSSNRLDEDEPIMNSPSSSNQSNDQDEPIITSSSSSSSSSSNRLDEDEPIITSPPPSSSSSSSNDDNEPIITSPP
eukprot:CAMPEP_0201547004 /NCGR_PEP_ID=MMETSP0173_2-20130828/3400_1 /ASSEMBLY_ACC=CAM_ASM_000268 /TAXON_ID=218659 /ORGANISM="Vexillifera sp., Strain DIVA3 564/2" /LENGTH=245 /DNA_ID=CAMNT_0047955881 /DNA_START=15 /DNA_END=748 /DNA_ORIENTATION=-